jgi:benzoyl-CoA reductase subunit C
MKDLPAAMYLCSYIPEEILHSAGLLPVRVFPSGNLAAAAGSRLSSNLCPFTRQVLSALQDSSSNSQQILIAAASCNAMVHLYTVLQDRPGLHVHLVDLPRHTGEKAIGYYAGELDRLIRFLGQAGHSLSWQKLQESMLFYGEAGMILAEQADGSPLVELPVYKLAETAPAMPREELNRQLAEIQRRSREQDNRKKAVLLTGALTTPGLIEILSGQTAVNVYLESCLGSRWLDKNYSPGEIKKAACLSDLVTILARAYLQKTPCPRMYNLNRQQLYDRLTASGKRLIQGIIYHDLSFCDLSHYDYLMIKQLCTKTGMPLLKVNSELGSGDHGQLKTRVEAFLELIG